MTGRRPRPTATFSQIDQAVAQGHRAALVAVWCRLILFVLLGGAVLAAALYLRQAPPVSSSVVSTPMNSAGSVAGRTAVTSNARPSAADPSVKVVPPSNSADQQSSPNAPTGVRVSCDISGKGVVVEWDAPRDPEKVTRYLVFVGDDRIAETGPEVREYAEFTSTAGSYSVEAIGPDDRGARSEPVQFPGAPSAPAVVAAVASSRGESGGWDLRVAWEHDNSDNCTVKSYEVRVNGGKVSTETDTNRREIVVVVGEIGAATVFAAGPGGEAESAPVNITEQKGAEPVPADPSEDPTSNETPAEPETEVPPETTAG